MLAALIAREGTVTGLLIVAALVAAALALLSLLAVAGAFGPSRPLPRRLLVLTAASIHAAVILGLALVVLQAFVEIVASAAA